MTGSIQGLLIYESDLEATYNYPTGGTLNEALFRGFFYGLKSQVSLRICVNWSDQCGSY